MTASLSIGWIVLLQWGATRDAAVIGHGSDEYKRIIQSSVALFGVVAIASYVLDLHLPRAYVLVMLPAGLFALLASRFVWRFWLRSRRMLGDFSSDVLVVGSAHPVAELITELERAPLAGYRVVGVCLSEKDRDTGDQFAGYPVLGNLDDVAAVAQLADVGIVAVTSTSAYGPTKVRRLGWQLESTSIDLVLAPALTNIAGPRIHTRPVAGLPLIHVDRPTYRGANRLLKRSFDVIGSALLLVVLAPVLLTLAAAIRISDRGPVFFRQERIGLNSQPFRMIKFRSMVTDAEAKLAELRSIRHDAGNDILFKLKDDPRITKIGHFLRRFSLDELPQLFNVLKGNMSLVGPRPPLQSEVALYKDDAMLRLLVKPGMTGLWQVSGRSDLAWEDTVRLDLYYVENWSITSDLVILWKTLKAVVASSGAY